MACALLSSVVKMPNRFRRSAGILAGKIIRRSFINVVTKHLDFGIKIKGEKL